MLINHALDCCSEYRDACKVKAWKYSLVGKNLHTCSDEVRDYLDENMPGWRDRIYSHRGQSSSLQMEKAREVVKRYEERGKSVTSTVRTLKFIFYQG